MSRQNQQPEEDERKYAVGGSLGCLIAILAGFIMVIAAFVLIFIDNVVGPQR